jgi:uncharacterized protein (DUF305 family)
VVGGVTVRGLSTTPPDEGSGRVWVPMAHRARAILAAAVLLAACSSADADDASEAAAPRIIQPGAPGEPSRELTPEELEEIDAELQRYTEEDVAFMQGMIAHHVQALRMTRMVPSRTSRDDVPLFAERMDLSQEDEIALMRRWLEDRDEEVPSLLAAHEHTVTRTWRTTVS